MEYTVQVYETTRGACPYSTWLEGLKDLQAKAKIRIRIERTQDTDIKRAKEYFADYKARRD